MKIVILSRLFAEKVVPDITIPHAVISITDPTNREPAEFELNEYLKAVLYLRCYDIDFSDGNLSHARAMIVKEYGHGMFTDAQAAQVIDFVFENKDLVKAFICHCDAGVSRSAGVGAAISLILNGSDKDIFNDDRYIPNMYVYRKILNEYQRRTYNEEQ
jgi:predicted protein tyrosine phosphatase